MTQLGLLEWSPPKVSPTASEQSRQIARVSGRIAEAVLSFCRAHVGLTFRAAELAAYVTEWAGGAPASADRVLRLLRKHGHVDVQVVDRSGSLYRVDAVRG